MRKRIDRRIVELGKSRSATSKAVTGSEAFLRHFMSSDTKQMGHANLIKLAEVLETTVDWIMFGNSKPETEDTAFNETLLVDALVQVSEKYEIDKENFESFAKAVGTVYTAFAKISHDHDEKRGEIVDLTLHRLKKQQSDTPSRNKQ